MAEAADEVGAARLAEQCDIPVEVLADRTDRSQVFVEPSGARRLRTSVVPQRVRNPDGSWAEISTDLIRGSDGMLRPEVSLADVAFSDGGDGPLVRWREDGSMFVLSWPTPLPKPRLEGSTAVYVEVLPDVDLHVTATRDGYQHAVEVKSASAAASEQVRNLRYGTGGDMRVTQVSDGSLRLVGKAGRTVAVSRSASMWDSSAGVAAGGGSVATAAGGPTATSEGLQTVGEPATATEPAVTSRVGEAEVAVSEGEMVVTASAAMLADPGLTYPLFIDPPFEKLRNKWSYSTSNGENNDSTGARVGKQPPDQYSSNGQLYRSYFGFDVSKLNGKVILDSLTRIRLDHSASCTPTWVHLYRTSAITVSSGARMAWTTRPLPSSVWLDAWEGNANEAGGCGSIQPDVDAEFHGTSLDQDLQLFADRGWDVYTVGLCACNESGDGESTAGRWKKFHTDKAWLEVTFNTLPGVPANLSAAGKPCGSTIGTSVVKLRAQYLDADGAANTVRGWFAYKEAGAPTHSSVADPVVRPAGNYGEVTIDFGSAANGKTYTFHVQTKDSLDGVSPVSPWCDFTINTTAGKVMVTSTAYPSDDQAHGGPGIAGDFTFQPDPTDSGAANIVSYSHGWSGQQPVEVTVPAGGSHTTQLTPPRYGLNTLEVTGKNSAGVTGAKESYQFLVSGPGSPVAHWPLTSIAEARLTDQIGDVDLVVDPVANDVGWSADTWLPTVETLRLDAVTGGTKGWAEATGTGLDTSGSFSVAAWVKRPTGSCTGSQTAVSMDAVNTSAFRLNYDCGTGHWRLRVANLDQATPLLADASATSPAPAGRWIHLAATWDEAEQRVRLYVDGQQTASVKPDSPWLSSRGTGWMATGPVVVGRDFASGTPGNAFTGEIRDVRVWNRVVVPDDIVGTDTHAGLMAAEQVARWTFNDGAGWCPSPVSSDGTFWQADLWLEGCDDPGTPQQTAGLTSDAYAGDSALWLNTAQPEDIGTAGNGLGHAYTSGPVIPSEQSLTVAGWVKLNAVTTQEQTVLRQADGAYKLATLPDVRWQFAIQSPGGIWSTAVSDTPATVGDWVHLAGVFHAGTGRVTLYVNGVKQATEGTGALGSPSSAPVFVGAANSTSGHLSGTLDQIFIYAGAVPPHVAARLHLDS